MYKYLSGRKEHVSQNNKYHLYILNIDYHFCASVRTSPYAIQQKNYWITTACYNFYVWSGASGETWTPTKVTFLWILSPSERVVQLSTDLVCKPYHT